MEALRTLKAQQDRVTEGVAAVEGVSRLNVHNPATHVVETYSPQCEGGVRDRARPAGECAPTGYVAYVSARMKVWPAERVGQAVSIAAERGAIGVRLEESGLDDPQALRREAVAGAVREARLQAEAVAKASGVVLGPLERVVDPDARASLAPTDNVESVVVTGSRIRPAVSLNVTPQPVMFDARVTAVFRIGR